MIFYEAPHKLRNTLDDLLSHFGGDREISLCREITKLNEEVCRTTLAEAVEIYREKEPRGEYVLVISGAKKTESSPTTRMILLSTSISSSKAACRKWRR